MHLTHDDVREILRLLDESPYDELKIETEGFSLTLKRTVETSGSHNPGRPQHRGSKTGTRHG